MKKQNSVLQVNSLSKSYGKKKVLEDITLQISPGSCYGLLGNNGAGKSTLINIIVDLVQADSGQVIIRDKTFSRQPLEIKSEIGVLPEQELLNPEFSGLEQLRFTGLLYGINKNELLSRIKTLFNYFFDDETELHKACGTYSTGMRKKLGLIAAVLHKPAVLILDEPFSGLDPQSSKAVINFLKAYLNENRIILLSSHNLSYVEQAATHIGVLHERKLMYSGPIDEFTGNGTTHVEQSLFNLLKADEKNLHDLKQELS